MLGDSRVRAVVPTHDITSSRRWYEDKLGLKVVQEQEQMGAVIFDSGGTEILLYQTQVNIPGEATVCAWEVDDIESTITDLESRGVVFEEYDLADFGYPEAGKGKIVSMPEGSEKAAWFKDPDGNILALGTR